LTLTFPARSTILLNEVTDGQDSAINARLVDMAPKESILFEGIAPFALPNWLGSGGPYAWVVDVGEVRTDPSPRA
jgi:hypothetical protein